MFYENENFLVVGDGISGRGVINFLKEKGANVFVLSSSNAEYENVKRIKKIKKEYGIKYAVVSAGIPLFNKVYKDIKKFNIKPLGELALVGHLSGKTCAITGTNGKTTTTFLIHHILNVAGKKSMALGNCGVSISENIKNIDDESYNIVETSSYMLEKAPSFKADVAIFLNLSADHIDHHKNIESYFKAKLLVFRNLSENDYAVLNADDALVVSLTLGVNTNKVFFSTNKEVDGAYLLGDVFYYKGEEICAVSDLTLIGNHNYSNVCAAIALAKIFGIENEAIKEALSNFVPIKHRLNNFLTWKNKKFINDSKATNISSALAAIKSVEEKKVLILGGSDKGEDFKNLFKTYLNGVEKIIIYGKTAGKIYKAAKEKFPKYCLFKVLTFKDAVHLAFSLTKEGQACLLSPACASFDQFRNFEERGDEFQKIIGELCEQNAD